jgi:hypothetical protein
MHLILLLKLEIPHFRSIYNIIDEKVIHFLSENLIKPIYHAINTQ